MIKSQVSKKRDENGENFESYEHLSGRNINARTPHKFHHFMVEIELGIAN